MILGAKQQKKGATPTEKRRDTAFSWFWKKCEKMIEKLKIRGRIWNDSGMTLVANRLPKGNLQVNLPTDNQQR